MERVNQYVKISLLTKQQVSLFILVATYCSYCYSKTVLYNDNNTVNTSIIGLSPNTTYTCCVLAVTSYGESEPVCQNITTDKTTSEFVYSCCNLLQLLLF